LKPRLAATGNRGNGKNHGRNSQRSRAHDRRTSLAAVWRITVVYDLSGERPKKAGEQLFRNLQMKGWYTVVPWHP
jgi:hypothetical protein